DGQVNESEVLNNVFDSCESNGYDNQVNDKFKKSEGYHAVAPPYTGNYMPPRANLSFAGLDSSAFKSKKTVKPSLEKIEFVNARNTTVKNENKAEKPKKFSQSPRAVFLTKSKQVPVNTAKQSSYRVATSVSIARHVNTDVSRSHVNDALQPTYSYFKEHSPVRSLFNQKSPAKTNNFNEKINTAKVNNVTTARTKAVVSTAEGNRNNALLDESQVLLKVPRNKNMYSFDLKNVVPVGGLTCLFTKATLDESKLWHRRLGHINFKTMNKLVRGNLVRGLPLKHFENDHTCVACQKRKQHKASCIRREFSVDRTSQQNGVIERKNMKLIEAVGTMLADSKLPTTFSTEAVHTACYVQNRVLVIKPHNKTPYELFL
nr:ribonuclease H-like domain-containing protein [Tanacetum cinerariifolium]